MQRGEERNSKFKTHTVLLVYMEGKEIRAQGARWFFSTRTCLSLECCRFCYCSSFRGKRSKRPGYTYRESVYSTHTHKKEKEELERGKGEGDAVGRRWKGNLIHARENLSKKIERIPDATRCEGRLYGSKVRITIKHDPFYVYFQDVESLKLSGSALLNHATQTMDTNPIKTAITVCSRLIQKKVYAIVVSKPSHGDLSPASVSYTAGFYHIPVIGISSRDSAFSDKVRTT